jgi:hypothetical protein
MLSDFKAAKLNTMAEPVKEHARQTVDTYFEFLKKTASSFPSGGTDFGEKLKMYSEQNIAATHRFMKQLGHVKDFEEMLRIQTEFMQTLMSSSAEQTNILAETYTKATSNVVDREELKPLPTQPGPTDRLAF